MSTEPSIKPISALHEILKWSKDRPEWQRVALRRIIVKDAIEDADLKDFERLCRSKYKADNSTDSAVKVEMLSIADLPPGPDSEESISLVSISSLQNVNKIPSNQFIPFGSSPGLTVIYGDNGSGKSGYARVIKKACRARGGAPAIRPNVYSSTASGSASATIECCVSGSNHPVEWKDGVESNPRLANIFVFDSFSAGHYLNEDGPAAFTPHGLDILPKLSKVCDIIKDRIQAEINIVNTSISNTVKTWKYNATTQAGKLIEKLSSNTKVVDVDNLAGFDAKQAQRLEVLQLSLKADPKQKAKETRAAATRLNTFAAKILATADGLAKDKVESLRLLAEKSKAAAETAKLFAAGQFDATYLTGSGDLLWKTLWEAARTFSDSVAYNGQIFPVVDGQARCVLCQQDLDEKAIARFVAFEMFCKDQSQKVAATAAKELKDAADNVASLVNMLPEYNKVEAELAVMAPELRSVVTSFVDKADECLSTINNNLVKGIWAVPVTIPDSPWAVITEMESSLQARATTEESAGDPDERKKLEVERDELVDREWFAGAKESVIEQIERYKRIGKLQECLKDTNTGSITSKSTQLTELLVTETFRDQFKHEVNQLGLRTLGVKLEKIAGKKGETKFGLRLAKQTNHKAVDIASEGEQRCVALAAFLAELSLASHNSALVFDDPVSSLDLRYREKIAARLAAESKIRQVIVFTHDAVFLNDLRECAIQESASVEFCHLEWNGSNPGCYVKGLPWDWMSTNDRIDKLEKEQRAIAKNWGPVPNAENVSSMRRAYSWLRATIERIVEKEVFADVVFRFRSYVEVKKLDRVIGFKAEECKEIQRLYQRCHDITDAHDPPPGKHASIPEPSDLLNDINAIKLLIDKIRTRRKSETSGS